MGGKQSGGIVEKSPLGCILAHWKDIGGPPGGSMNKRPLIKYCNQGWPLYKLDDEEKWPLNGTLNYNTLLQLMLFLRRERKRDEVSYANTFFTLRNHPEYQINCGLMVPWDPLVLGVEKDNKREGEGKLERSCSACSIGQIFWPLLTPLGLTLLCSLPPLSSLLFFSPLLPPSIRPWPPTSHFGGLYLTQLPTLFQPPTPFQAPTPVPQSAGHTDREK